VLDKILKIPPINNKKKNPPKKNAKMSDGSEKTTKSLESVQVFFFEKYVGKKNVKSYKYNRSSIHVNSTLEPNGLSQDDGKRPAGMTLVPWIKAQPSVWDVTIVDTLADSYVLKTSEVSGFAAEMACKRKHSKYSSIISSNYVFKGFAFETFGPWCKETIDFINVIGNQLLRNQAIQNQRNPFSRGFPLPFNVGTLQAFGALFQIPHYYRKFLYYKTKMLRTVASTEFRTHWTFH
jgi:hypothetical protein